MLRGAAQSAIAAQSEDQSPFRIRTGIEHTLCHIATDEVVAGSIWLYLTVSHIRKRVFLNDFVPESSTKQLLGPPAPPPHRVFTERFLQLQPKIVRVTGMDFGQPLPFAEILHQIFSYLPQGNLRPLFQVRSRREKRVNEWPQRGRFALGNQADLGKLVRQRLLDTGQPA